MAKIKIFSIVILLIFSFYLKGQAILFNDGWFFHRIDAFAIDESSLIKDGKIPEYWEKVSLPHTARIEPLIVNDQWQGICYYAKKFSLENNLQDKKLFLKFDAAMNVADVWVNGNHLTTHLGGYLPFTLDISDKVKPGEENIIVVRLDNRDNTTTGPKPLYRLDFNMYGGIYRNVWLIEKSKLHITDPIFADKPASGGIMIKTSNISQQSAKVDVQTQISNAFDVSKNFVLKQSLLDANKGILKTTQKEISINAMQNIEDIQTVVLENPKLWTPDTPYLYYILTEIISGNKVIDKEETRIGIRDVNIVNEGLWLNGEKTFLRGVNRHQEYPYVGYALSDIAQRRDAYKIKMAGFDFVRTSHYPVSPAFLDACDEYGIFVLEPILGWQYFGDFKFEEHAKKSAREMIRRDRNRPCILAWELSINEIKMPDQFIKDIVALGHEEQPESYVAGWRKDKNYDIYIEARQHRKEAWYEKPLIVSEYGDWEYYAMNAGFEQDKWQNMLQEDRCSRQSRASGEIRMLQQATNVQEAHNDNLSTHALADGYWVMYDYNRGYVNDLEESGIMNIFRLPKYAYYFYQSQRDYNQRIEFSKPMIQIASYWEPNVSNAVRIFSNCDEVELFIDGKSKGKQLPDNNKISSNLKHPPFTFNYACTKGGTLKAIGYVAGKKVVEQSLSTADAAYKIELMLDESGNKAKAGCNDVLFVYAQIKDKRGNLAYKFNEDISFSVDGDIEIVKDSNPKAEAGIATVLIKIGTTSGKGKIIASHPKLGMSELEFTIE